jgi:hypothetical protein
MSAPSNLPFSGRALAFAALAAAGISLCMPMDAARAEGFGFANFSAFVNKNGNTVRSSGVQGASRTSTGQYVVEFSRDVSTCVYVASLYGKKAGSVTARKFPGDPTKIRVYTFAGSSQPKNLAFLVIVSCSS